MDASTSASRVIVNGDLYGSVEYMAMVISEATGGRRCTDTDGNALSGQFRRFGITSDNERQNDIRPALATEIENFDDYDVIFVGYPHLVVSDADGDVFVLDEYDFTGKTLIPFSSHGGSGWSGTVDGHCRNGAKRHDGGRLQHFAQQRGRFGRRHT